MQGLVKTGNLIVYIWKVLVDNSFQLKRIHMEPKYLLFVQEEHEQATAAYLTRQLGMGQPILLQQFMIPGAAPGDSNGPVVLIVQERLATEHEEIGGSLYEGIKSLKKAGIIVLPDACFGQTGIGMMSQRVADQLQKSIRVIMDGTQAAHAVFYIDAS